MDHPSARLKALAPDMAKLEVGDEAAWADVFQWLWPAAKAKASMTCMQRCCPADVEDVASKALAILVRKVKEGRAKRFEDLKALLYRIVHDEAISWCRRKNAQKRGGGMTNSQDEMMEDDKSNFELAIEDSPLAKLEISDLGDLIREAGQELKPREWALLEDFFLSGLSYKEISGKHEIAVGSVGVYLKRALEKLRPILEKYIYPCEKPMLFRG